MARLKAFFFRFGPNGGRCALGVPIDLLSFKRVHVQPLRRHGEKTRRMEFVVGTRPEVTALSCAPILTK